MHVCEGIIQVEHYHPIYQGTTYTRAERFYALYYYNIDRALEKVNNEICKRNNRVFDFYCCQYPFGFCLFFVFSNVVHA